MCAWESTNKTRFRSGTGFAGRLAASQTTWTTRNATTCQAEPPTGHCLCPHATGESQNRECETARESGHVGEDHATSRRKEGRRGNPGVIVHELKETERHSIVTQGVGQVAVEQHQAVWRQRCKPVNMSWHVVRVVNGSFWPMAQETSCAENLRFITGKVRVATVAQTVKFRVILWMLSMALFGHWCKNWVVLECCV
mmetsp:Transcript_93721/g.185861  ORF Transcript_93721/g.185861 Transcript_93721/m.185861 type:complete len:197 (+) Transcript_93721:1293-1883(+)